MVPKPFKIYWNAYGGFSALFSSVYFYASFVLVALLHGLWWPEDAHGQRPWASLALSILPSMAAFSLGAMAIVFAMTSGSYVKLLHKDGAPDSAFMKLVATFFHFVLLQVLAIIFALSVEAYDFLLLSGVGFWLFSYALLAGVAAAANLVLVADIKNSASVLDD